MTVYEQLAAAYPLHFHRIVECIYAWDPRNGGLFLDLEASAGAGWTLYQAFDWRLTNEGVPYWRSLADGSRL